MRHFICCAALLLTTASVSFGQIRDLAGFRRNELPKNSASALDGPNGDDWSTAANIGFSIQFGGRSYSTVYVNTNGNITLSERYTAFDPAQLNLAATGLAVLAPFFADVDTRASASEPVRYGTDTINGRPAFGVNYVNVGLYNSRADRRNSFQLVLLSRPDTGAGNFDVEFNYSDLTWDRGDAVDGQVQSPALMGFANGASAPSFSYQHPGSLAAGAFLNTGPNSLVRGSNVGIPGRWVFSFRGGLPSGSMRISNTSLPAGRVGEAYVLNLSVQGGTAPFSWSASQPPGMPPGLTLSTAGVISGTPTQAGTFSPILRVRDSTGAQAEARLSITIAQGNTPPTPPPPSTPIRFSMSGMQFPMNNGQQQTVRIEASRAAAGTVTGSLTLAFTPSVSGAGDDPNYRFTNGSRSVSFVIPSGATQAVLSSAVSLQTGTTAGRVRLSIESREGTSVSNELVAEFAISPARPTISSVRMVRQGTGFELCVTGFSNTRETSAARFTVTYATGAQAGWQDSFRQDVSSAFRSWFATTTSQSFGGQFLYVQPFAVQQGNSSAVARISVLLQNGSGESEPYLFDMSNVVSTCN